MTTAALEGSSQVPKATGPSLPDAARIATALALAASGIIHLAYAPVHLDEAFDHGMFFLAAGWLQLGLAVGLAFRIRPERAWWAVTAIVSLAIVAVWVISRTVGVPGSDREGVGFPDVTATVLEIVAAGVATALLLGRVPDRRLPERPLVGMAGVGTVTSVVLVSLAVSPTFAGDHGPGATGHSHGGAADAEEAMTGHGHGSEASSDQGWAQTRMDALAGYASPEQVADFKRIEGDYLAGQIRDRSDLLRDLPEAEREERIDAYVAWVVDNTIALLEGAQANSGEGGDEGMHTHGPVEWQPITDTEDLLVLQDQLEASGQVIEQFPTVADAEAGGYRQISPYVPGIGAHWINGDFDDSFDPARPEMILYNGTDPTSEVVGLSYAAIGPEAPEGFVGPNDGWHSHPGLCMLGGLVVGIDGTPEELCESIGGEIATSLADLWMMHLWQVPGWESPWGLFSAENPQINVATSDIGRTLIP
ncbi:MAG: hypothetical protein ACRD2C_04880 [Acidimicrobiales bacterium]